MLWFSRGVLDLYAQPLQGWYRQRGPAHSPRFAVGWRPGAWPLMRNASAGAAPLGAATDALWSTEHLPAGRYRVVGRRPTAPGWQDIQSVDQPHSGPAALALPGDWDQVELLVDRRDAMGASLRPGAPVSRAR